MSIEDYNKAYKLGKKEYQMRQARGERPTLEVLDEILPPRGQYSEVSLGIVQIPMKQLVGTKTAARSNAFAANFMPLFPDKNEFSEKWASLCKSHLEEGIREPIKAYEYMNRFYVLEGNKRVSVLKYFDAVSVPGEVIRIVPQQTEEKENKIYFEFLQFYDLSKINYIWFSELGAFAKLQKEVGKEAQEQWNEEERLEFSSIYNRFSAEYEGRGGSKLHITTGDAFLNFIQLYSYEEVCQMPYSQMRELIRSTWEEFELQEKTRGIDLKMDPNGEKVSLITRLLPMSMPKQKVAFIYEKTPDTSAWTKAHELGRIHLEETFSDEIRTIKFENVTQETIDATLTDAIDLGCTLIFTTTPTFVKASVKAAIAHPTIRIVNCSVNTSHRYIRNYYIRMYEAKFLMGAIAAALSEGDLLGYIADYPLYGTISYINAFALGAKMVNPRAKVQLEWSTLKQNDYREHLKNSGIRIISGKDMSITTEESRMFGLYQVNGEEIQNLAMPLAHWGNFYERLIRTIMNGTWKNDDDISSKKAINYWWGISADVLDVVCSTRLPIGTKRLVDLLKHTIRTGEFHPFSGVLYSQQGVVQSDPERSLTPEEIIAMDWLAENVIGFIPKMEELQEEALPVMEQQGLERDK